MLTVLRGKGGGEHLGDYRAAIEVRSDHRLAVTKTKKDYSLTGGLTLLITAVGSTSRPPHDLWPSDGSVNTFE